MFTRILAAGCLTVAALLLAVPDPAPAQGVRSPVLGPGAWSYGPIYGGWRATTLLDAEVRGPDGADMGAVVDLSVDGDGSLDSIVVDTGEARYLVPWAQVKVSADRDVVVVPVDRGGLTRMPRGDGTGAPGGWRVGAMLGRDVALADRPDYGRVDDVVFGLTGRVAAVVVDPAGTDAGPYALPWDLAAPDFDPAHGTLALPVTAGQLQGQGAFDYGRMQDGVFAEE